MHPLRQVWGTSGLQGQKMDYPAKIFGPELEVPGGHAQSERRVHKALEMSIIESKLQ